MAFLNKCLTWVKSVSPKNSEGWIEKELPEIIGRSRNVVIRCSPFPFKEKEDSRERKYIYSDFGGDFRSELMDVQLSDWETVKSCFEERGEKIVTVKLKKCQQIKVDIGCAQLPSKHQFFSDMADALIDAMEKNRIYP